MRWDVLRSAMLGSLVCLPISLALIAMPLAAPANADVVAPADMLQLNNQLRFAIGSPTVPADPRLTQAAINHANYSSANGQGGHYETAGLPYYTGYAPRDRLIAAGWTTSFVSEVATGGAGLAGVRQLWDAPYHRLGMMHPNGTKLPIYYAAQQFEYDYQVIIPQQPLAVNTTYHVRFDITVAGTYVTNEWDFSTGSTVSSGGGTSSVPPDSGLHSTWASQTTLPAMQPAAQGTVTLQFRNIGTKTWTKGVVGSQVALGVRGDSTAYSTMGLNVGWP